MLLLSPHRTTLLGKTLGGVQLVALDRRAPRLVREWSDLGPHLVFADAAEQLVQLRIVRRPIDPADAAASFAPGAQGALTVSAATGAAQSAAIDLSCQVVIEAVEHDFSDRKGAVQTIRCLALSSDGAQDPITITERTP